MTPSLASLVSLAALLLAAPLVPGIITRTKAVLAGRRGAPVWQLYADLWKLARRGTVYSSTTTGVFRLAPAVLVATTVAAASLVPLDGHASPLRFAGDAVAFAYLFALGRFVLVLAALDTGSSFEGMGASRDVAFASLAEVGLFLAFSALGIAAHSFSLTTMLGERASAGVGAFGPSAIVLAASVFALALAECARVPVDDPATHLELTMVHEVMVLDHSGPDLAMILYAGALKLALFGAVMLAVLWPGTRAAGWAGGATIALALVGFGVTVGVVESAIARLRLPKVPLFLAGSAALAVLGLILELA